MIDSTKLEVVGTALDPAAIFGTVGYRKPVDYCLVNGNVTVRKGRLCNVDEDRLAAEAEKKCMEYLGKN